MGRCVGGFADYALMDAREALRMPARLSWEQAAAIPLAFMVTHDMLVTHGRLQPGEWLLITGVSSGVGVASLQVGKALGAKVIGTSGSAEKLAKLEQLGLDVGVVTRGGGFREPALKATDRQGRRPRRQQRRRHRVRGVRPHARLSKAAWRPSAISIAR